MSPLDKCPHCVVKEKSNTLDGVWWWSIETLVPLFGKKHVTQAHLISLGVHVKNLGNCYNRYKAKTACGVSFETDVDSSD